ncbi:MAG: hypothetical protein ABIK19_05110, partial [candidate division WOR-3 bacterium]
MSAYQDLQLYKLLKPVCPFPAEAVQNIVGKCPRSLRGVVPAEAKLIFYATSQAEARQRFNEFQARWHQQLPHIVDCLEK